MMVDEELNKAGRLWGAVAQFADGFDVLDDHFVITDNEGRIIYANPAAERHTGYLFAEMIGKRAGDLWGGHMSSRFYNQMWQRIKVEKKPFIGMVRNRRKDGTEYWQELRISPVVDERGNVSYYIGNEPVVNDRNIEKLLNRPFKRRDRKLNKVLLKNR